MFTVYVLQKAEGRLYVGQTADLERRLEDHATGRSRWTRNRGPWTLVHSEEFQTRAEAMARERTLKTGRANQQLRSTVEQSFPRSGKD